MLIIVSFRWLVGVKAGFAELKRKQRALLAHFFTSDGLSLINGRVLGKGSIQQCLEADLKGIFNPLPGKHPVCSEAIKFVDN